MKHKQPDWLNVSLTSVAKIHFALIAIYIAQIIVYDSSKLITPEVVLQRWLVAAGLAVIATLVF